METKMERNADNNWGDQMIFENGLRPRCPKCGAKCDDDGDRYYTDICWECGWDTYQHRAHQNINTIRKYQGILERGRDVYLDARKENSTDWKYIAGQTEVAIQMVLADITERQERMFGDE
jgi:predicted  nucleic acid-binding Zn-ribbon protein